jgi:hypothetical protein
MKKNECRKSRASVPLMHHNVTLKSLYHILVHSHTAQQYWVLYTVNAKNNTEKKQSGDH